MIHHEILNRHEKGIEQSGLSIFHIDRLSKLFNPYSFKFLTTHDKSVNGETLGYLIGFGTTPGKFYNPHGPTRIYCLMDGKFICSQYNNADGDVHRDDGPAELMWDTKGDLIKSVYMQNNQMHREDGPADVHKLTKGKQTQFREGKFSDLYYIRGVKVNEAIVMRPQEMNISYINSIQNLETKRIAIERFGWLRYLEENSACVIDQNTDPVSGTNEMLVQLKGFTDQFNVSIILVCACPSTARVYSVVVPNNIYRCTDAQKFLKGPTYNEMQVVGAS